MIHIQVFMFPGSAYPPQEERTYCGLPIQLKDNEAVTDQGETAHHVWITEEMEQPGICQACIAAAKLSS